MKIFAAALFATSIALLSGCTSDHTREGAAPAGIAFAPEAESEGASVFLRGHSEPLAQNRLVIDVIARSAPDLHGAAFRLTWDPDTLAFVDAKSGDLWSKQGLAMAKEGSPGQLAVVWSEKGEMGIDATRETVLGTLTFESRGHSAAPLTFKTERSQLVDKKGIRVDAKWHGGTVSAR